MALEYFDLSMDSGENDLPQAAEVKTFINQSLVPRNALLGENFFKMTLMPMMVFKDIADPYDCSTPDSQLYVTSISPPPME